MRVLSQEIPWSGRFGQLWAIVSTCRNTHSTHTKSRLIFLTGKTKVTIICFYLSENQSRFGMHGISFCSLRNDDLMIVKVGAFLACFEA